MAFLFFHGMLCNLPKRSRGKNLIILPLWGKAYIIVFYKASIISGALDHSVMLFTQQDCRQIIIRQLGQFVQKPVKANPGLKVNQSTHFSCIKMFFSAHVLCSFSFFKLKPEGQTIKTESNLSWVSLMGLWTTRPWWIHRILISKQSCTITFHFID